MTNNTHLLNCPFCGTDDVDPTGVLNGDETRSPECMGCGATAPTVATWSCRITASAEDVRAVVEEPVGYGAWNTGTNPGTRLMRYDGMVAISPEASDFYKVPVYLRPQHPVVLPERIPVPNGGLGALSRKYADGFNACLDAVEELNK